MAIQPQDAQPPSLLTAIIASALRHGLTAMGALVIAMAPSEKGSVAQFVTAAVGLAPLIAGLSWSWLEKHTKIQTIKGLLGS